MLQTTSNFDLAMQRLSKKPYHRISIEDYGRVFTNRPSNLVGIYDWISGIDPLTLTVSDMDGGANLGQLTFTVQDRGGQITGDFPTFTFEGKRITLRTGLAGMAVSDMLPVFTGLITSVESTNGNQDYIFTCQDVRQELTKVIYTAGDSGKPTDNDNPKTINGHPLDILLNILNNELGLGSSDIDVAKITGLRDFIYSGTQFEFKITSPPVAKDFIENELMKPLAAYIWPSGTGKISINSFYPAKNSSDLASFFALTPANIIGIPTPEQSALIDTTSIRFDQSDDGKFLAEAVNNYSPGIQKYGLYGQQIIESAGLRSGFQGFYLANLTSFLIFLRYGFKAMQFGGNAEFTATWDAVVLEPGDGVRLTHPKVPNRLTGTMGVTDAPFEVLDKTYNWQNGTVKLKLLDISAAMAFQLSRIAPSSQPVFTSATSAQKSRYLFLSGDDGKMSDGTVANTLS